MKKFVFILLFVVSQISIGRASHILGGEITYEHIEDLKYKVWVTIYRDCDECKIAGGGGGSSTKECGSFDLYVQQSDRYTCGISNLGKHSLTRSEIKPIIPVCSSTKTRCEANSNFGYGVEAHLFYTIIDFNKYSSSASCGFDLYVKIFDRAGDIDNINGADESFYNYAFINPYKAHSSPVFEPNPSMVLPVNQPLRTIVSRFNENGDSVAYKLGEPLLDYKKSIAFADGYSINKPLTVWCNGSSMCTPNATANPPVGYAFDSHSGALSFTPVRTGEKAVLVYEAQIFRKNGSNYQLIGVVRRDIQIITIISENHAPQISQGNQTIHICEGDSWEFDVEAEDKAFQFPDGSTSAEQTVSFVITSDIATIDYEQVKISQAPFNKLALSWQPTSKDVREKPYRIYVTATDDNCPLNARQTVVYEVIVHPRPIVKIETKRLWCGNIEKGVSSLNGTISKSQWTWFDYDKNEINSTEKRIDTFLAPVASKYFVKNITTNAYGCSFTSFDSIEITDEELNGLNLKIIGDQVKCVDDVLKLNAQFKTTAKINSITWVNGASVLSNLSSFDTLISDKTSFPLGIQVVASGNLGRLKCMSAQYIYPEINRGPTIVLNKSFDVCAYKNIDLNEYSTPLGGQWSSISHTHLEGNLLMVDELSTIAPTKLCQAYRVVDTGNGCFSHDTMCVTINPLPMLELQSATICNFVGSFNLALLITEPFGLEGATLDWEVDGKADAYILTDGKYMVDLSLLTNGDHSIQCKLTNRYGCEVVKKTKIRLIKNLEIEADIVNSICQEDSRDLSDIFNVDPKGGIWNSFSQFDQVLDNKVSSEFCGVIDLNYTYDRYGCYATADYNLEVLCKPVITINFPDTICSTQGLMQLKATPDNGYFTGQNVVGSNLDTEGLLGDVVLTYHLESDGCSFTQQHNVFVAPVPKFMFDPLPKVLCPGDSLVMKNVLSEHGSGYIEIASKRFDIKQGFYPSLSYNITLADKQKGFIAVIVEFESKFKCLSYSLQTTIDIEDAARIVSIDSQIACAPFDWTPTFTKDGNGVNWNKADVFWNFGDYSSANNIYKGLNPKHTFETDGSYEVKISSKTEHGCLFDTSFSSLITVHETPEANFDMLPNRPVSQRLPEVWFINKSKGTGDLFYHWDFGTIKSRDTSNLSSPKFYFIGDTGSYVVTLSITNIHGCADHVAKTVRVGQDIQMYIPNAFTPNGKGPELTERYKVVGNNIQYFDMEIVNRWGEVVFQTSDINESWDGMFMGQLCINGIYAYRIKAISNTGGEYDFSGTINLIR